MVPNAKGENIGVEGRAHWLQQFAPVGDGFGSFGSCWRSRWASGMVVSARASC